MGESDNDIKYFFGVGIAILLVMTGLWMVFGLADNQESVNPIILKMLGLGVALFFSAVIVIGIRRTLKK